MIFNTEAVDSEFLVQQGSNQLTIAFAGLGTGLCEVRHDFYNLTSGLDCSKIFVKDRSSCWYQQGINTDINTIPLLLDKLKSEIEILNPVRITCIGISAGGYAALLFGALLQVDIVHAFGPQTFLSPIMQSKFNMNSEFLGQQLSKMYSLGITTSPYFDIKHWLSKNINTKYKIHICNQHIGDIKHAYYIVDLPNVEIIEYECTQHSPAAFLKQNGQLANVLENS